MMHESQMPISLSSSGAGTTGAPGSETMDSEGSNTAASTTTLLVEEVSTNSLELVPQHQQQQQQQQQTIEIVSEVSAAGDVVVSGNLKKHELADCLERWISLCSVPEYVRAHTCVEVRTADSGHIRTRATKHTRLCLSRIHTCLLLLGLSL